MALISRGLSLPLLASASSAMSRRFLRLGVVVVAVPGWVVFAVVLPVLSLVPVNAQPDMLMLNTVSMPVMQVARARCLHGFMVGPLLLLDRFKNCSKAFDFPLS